MEPIRSLQNRAVVEAGRLHRARDRQRTGTTLVEGPHILGEAVSAGVDVHTVFALPDDPDRGRWPAVRLVDEAVMRKLAGTASPRGPVAVVSIPPESRPPGDRAVLALWGVSDPGNVGTIVRTAAAFAFGVAVGPGTADPWAPKVIRAGAGAHFRTEVFPAPHIGDLGRRPKAALVVAGGVDPTELVPGPWAVIVGSEAHGLSTDVVESCDERVTIPMEPASESLNAAVAASVVAYALSRSGGAVTDH